MVDYLNFYWRTWHWPAFNLADIFVVLGALLMAISAIYHKRQQDLQRLHQLSKTQVPTPKSPTNLNNNGLAYQKSMLQNHARLIELAEFGSSLKLSNPIRRYLKSLSGDVTSELSMLNNILGA